MEFKKLDWNELSDLGLVERINKEILHPLGIAVYRDPEDGTSSGALISPDGEFSYGEIKSKIISDEEVIRRVHDVRFT